MATRIRRFDLVQSCVLPRFREAHGKGASQRSNFANMRRSLAASSPPAETIFRGAGMEFERRPASHPPETRSSLGPARRSRAARPGDDARPSAASRNGTPIPAAYALSNSVPRPIAWVRAAIVSEVREYLADRLPSPAIALVHAPVFFGCAFSAYAEFASPARATTAGAPTFDIAAEVSAPQLAARLSAAGFTVAGEDDPPLSNVSVAGESQLFVTPPARDLNVENASWLWGAVDNLRLASANALRIAERLLVS